MITLVLELDQRVLNLGPIKSFFLSSVYLHGFCENKTSGNSPNLTPSTLRGKKKWDTNAIIKSLTKESSARVKFPFLH